MQSVYCEDELTDGGCCFRKACCDGIVVLKVAGDFGFHKFSRAVYCGWKIGFYSRQCCGSCFIMKSCNFELESSLTVSVRLIAPPLFDVCV